jgi:hypothetical protein
MVSPHAAHDLVLLFVAVSYAYFYMLSYIFKKHESIDSLSLAMFEALRGLRDAVAPESGNLGGNANNNPVVNSGANSINTSSSSSLLPEPDISIDDLWHAYRSGEDRVFTAMITKVNSGVVVQKRDDFVRLHAKMEMEKDTELVFRLAGTVLAKSNEIDQKVDALPGMHRTSAEQMKYIEDMLEMNLLAAVELEAAYSAARERRNACRAFIRDSTCQALGIEEDTS